MKQYDVVIVGAGPAGALAAYLLARAGKSVALLDRAAFPRPKICGDTLNPRCLPILRRLELGKAFNQLPHHVPRGLSLELDDRVVFSHEFPEHGRTIRAVSREIFDDWLRREGEEAGVEFFGQTTVRGITFEGDVSTNNGDFKGTFVLGADGRNSIVARRAGLMPHRSKGQRVAWQAQLDGSLIDDDIHMRVFDEGYYGLVKHSPDCGNICVIISQRGSATPQSIVNRYFPGCGSLAWHSIHPVTRHPASAPGKGRLWLAGDAYQVVEPFTGQGIYLALAGAEVAAACLMHALESRDVKESLGYYVDHCRKLYGPRLWVNRFVRWTTTGNKRAKRVLGFLERHPALLRRMLRAVQGTDAA